LTVLERRLRAAAICPRHSIVAALVSSCDPDACGPQRPEPVVEASSPTPEPVSSEPPPAVEAQADPSEEGLTAGSPQGALASLPRPIEQGKDVIALLGDAEVGKSTVLRDLHAALGGAPRSILLSDPVASLEDVFRGVLNALELPADDEPAEVSV